MSGNVAHDVDIAARSRHAERQDARDPRIEAGEHLDDATVIERLLERFMT
jgi:hypothetical protein